MIGTILRWLNNFFLLLADSFFARLNISQDSNYVLIVRLDLIGDFILWLDTAVAMASYYRKKGMHVILLANDDWSAMAEKLDIFDQVLTLNKSQYCSNLKYRIRMNTQIRNLNCTVAIQPAYSRELFSGDSVIRICGSRERVGSVGNLSNIRSWQKSISDNWYTRLIPADPGQKMELLRNAEFVSGLTGEKHISKVFDLATFNSFFFPDTEKIVKKYIDGTYFLLSPGASFAGKRWPLEYFAQVAEYVHQKTGWRGVICGSQGEAGQAEILCELMGRSLINLTGVTTLIDLALIVAGAKLVLANDTSTTHLAAAVGVPVVCIAGGGQYGRFVPYEVEALDGRPLPFCIIHRMNCFGCNWDCKFDVKAGDPMPCVGNVTVPEVLNVIDNILAIK